jgi:integrase
MAAIRKNGKKWVAEVRTKGAYRSKTFATKAEAQRWSYDMELQLGKHPGVSITHSLGEAMARYAREVSITRKGVRWETVRLNKIQRDPIASIMLADLRRDDIQSWIARQKIGPASINRELTVIASVLRECRTTWKWMTENPLLDVRRPMQPAPRDRLINDNELERLLLALEYDEALPVTTIRQEIAVGFLIALETAMRQGEIWGLDWSLVFLDRKFVTLPETKNGMRRDVALSARAVALFRNLTPKKSGPVFHVPQASSSTIFRRAVEMAGLVNFTFHDSRHAAITRLARKLDLLDLARMVGHRDIRSLQIYYNATAEDIASRLD